MDPSAIRRLGGEDEARQCAEMMAASEPWITLGRTADVALRLIGDPNKEVYVAVDDRGVAGFIIIDMRGTFAAYLQSICVRPDCRGQGVGARLMAFLERRAAQSGPNVFLCVSSFNARAQQFYARLGYERVGILTNFVVQGHDEILLRKTSGPLVAARAGGGATS